METNILSRLQKEKAKRSKDGLYHQTQILLAYHSNRIDGNVLTEEQTRYIYDTNTLDVSPHNVVHVDHVIEAVNHFACFDYVLDTMAEELTEEMIIDFHRILNTGTSDFRKEWYTDGKYKPHPDVPITEEAQASEEIGKAMNALLEWYDKIFQIDFTSLVDFHYRFEKIRPFHDGNGRVGRIILFRECLKFKIVPFIIEDENKELYNQGLKEFEKNPAALIDPCLAAQEKYKELLREFSEGK